MRAYIIILGATSLANFSLFSSALLFAQEEEPTNLTLSVVTIASANKFQQILPKNTTGMDRRALIVKNNNTNGDSCWVFVGV